MQYIFVFKFLNLHFNREIYVIVFQTLGASLWPFEFGIFLNHFLLLFSHSLVSNSATPWTAACQTSLSFTITWNLLKLMSIESVMVSNHLILCHPLLLLPSIFPSIRVFSSKMALCIRWPKYWGFSFIISPSNEYLGLISFRIDWLDLLAVQGTLKSLPQHHSSKASVLQCSAFFTTFYILVIFLISLFALIQTDILF